MERTCSSGRHSSANPRSLGTPRPRDGLNFSNFLVKEPRTKPQTYEKTSAAMNPVQASTGKVLAPKSLAHVVLRTPNFNAMVAFYKSFFGGWASYENDRLAFLTYDDEHHRIAIFNVPGTGPKNRASAGLEHIAFSYDKLDDLLLAYRQRKSIGMLPIWCTNHGITMSIYYQDPDGNQLETQVDVFGTVEEANAFMDSEDFEENPFGVDFEPEELILRLKNGEDPNAMMRRARLGPRKLETLPLLNPPTPDLRESYDAVRDNDQRERPREKVGGTSGVGS
ncbi:hypothetical protein N0V82_004872 [Gnomoniopsis sp. IMI 355080]|nr:hypothetical protein N0V82_004872 [Gnomoniopsis sp. IMI 355080]